LTIDTRQPTQTRRKPLTVIALIGLLALLAFGAVQGGFAMVTNPLEPLGMPLDYLEKTPVDTYLWPGVFFLAIAGASLLTVSGLLFDWPMRWAFPIEARVGYRWPWIGALSTGTVLLAFEILELFLIPFHPVMHPLLLAGSAAIIWLTWTHPTREHLRVDTARPGTP
jgi:hypothetical protein